MVLYEHFNTTNQTIPFAEAHESFVVYLKFDDCGLVEQMSHEKRCNFVKKTESCHDHMNMIDYIQFVYCTVHTESELLHWLIMIALIILVCYIFTILGTTADKFLCPALTVISTSLHMNENLAGVTILAFGNGSPDLFTSLAHLEGENTAMLISEAYGAACFVIGVISGIILIIRPFKVYSPPFVRDSLFLLLISTFIRFIMFDGSINLAESVFIVFIYILYITVVIMDQFILLHKSKEVKRKINIIASGRTDAVMEAELRELKDQGMYEVLGIAFDDMHEDDEKSTPFVGETPNTYLFKQMFDSLNPIDRDVWKDAGVFGKIFIIIKAPAIFALLLTIPIVNYDMTMNGWSKLLNILQLLITPVFLVILNRKWDVNIFHVTIFVYILAISVPLMIAVFMTSRTDKPPVYHTFYAFFAMVTCIFIIQILASEIVAILSTVGIAAKLTPSFLGCTILAWGNSVGDLFSNITLAKQGRHKMGFAACYGGPLIIPLPVIILGIGISFVYKTSTSPIGIQRVRQGSMGPMCNLFLMLIVLGSLSGVGLAKFQARRSVGYFLLTTYFFFLVYAGLGEFEIVHLGTDHQDQRVSMD